MITKTILIGLLVVAISVACLAQDYDDEGYGNQGANNNNNNNQAEGDSYGPNYAGNDDSYNVQPQYQNNVDSEGSNNNPNYNSQAGADPEGDYGDSDDNSAAASSLQLSVARVKRSTEPKLRVKRHGKYYIGPVYTYVKTDKHANFKWGVKHKVGKKHYG